MSEQRRIAEFHIGGLDARGPFLLPQNVTEGNSCERLELLGGAEHAFEPSMSTPTQTAEPVLLGNGEPGWVRAEWLTAAYWYGRDY